ncbi:hypothetical protein H9638_07755 [Arthrobacter sp. Sa2BUA2]|uniref:Glycosyltransferase RgtA/B/C/D-like domain-containing protein n=1 Tax=Arthrobacter pullicola TaxID=2762224 RepID=A0ABR8YHV0_9MICC|nr:hypothetical protein [Arthrobacter pullicola]MBD8043706.1 hypothetical protein [Arthrobacter pullicola]
MTAVHARTPLPAGPETVPRKAGLLPRIAGLAWCAVILWLLCSNLVLPSFGISRYETWAAVLGGAGVLGLTVAFPWLLARMDAGLAGLRWLRVLLSVLGWSVLFSCQARAADAVRLPPDWDAAPVFYSALALADGAPGNVDVSYFQINPNNLLLMLLLSKFMETAQALGVTDLRQSVAYLNAAVLFCGMLLTYAAAALLGGRQTARLTLVPSIILILFSPWLPVFYSDTVGLLFPILIFCLLAAAGRCRWPARMLLWAAAGAAAAVGYGIKPTVLICLAAAALVGLFSIRRGRWRQDALSVLLAMAVAGGSFAGMHGAVQAWERSSVVNGDPASREPAIPPTHFLKVGAQQYPGPNGDYYGAYNEPDRLGTLSIEDPQERFDAGLQAYRERVEAMGPAGYAGFLNAKLRWITGDGSFFGWGEGGMTADQFLADDGLSRSIQDFYGPGRPGFGFSLSLWQGTWFLLLALCGGAVFLRDPRLAALGPVMARISLLGLLLFLMFSEGRARFLYLYVPYFIVLGAVSLQCLPVLTGRWGATRRGRQPVEDGAKVVE